MKRQSGTVYDFSGNWKPKVHRCNSGDLVIDEDLKAENDTEIVIYRCMGWLILLNPDHRPKSKEKLYNSICKLCYSLCVKLRQVRQTGREVLKIPLPA